MVDEKNQSDIVNQAFDALRATPPRQGPSLQALERTLQAVHQAQESANVTSLAERIRHMNKFIKYPIAAGLALALILGAAYALLGTHAAVAFADVKAQFQKAKSIQMTVVTEGQMNGQSITIRMKMMAREPKQSRYEAEMPYYPPIEIVDTQAKKMLTLDPANKVAVLTDLLQMPAQTNSASQDFLANIRKLLDGMEKPLGERVIDGKAACGFWVTKDMQEMEIWVEKVSGKPLMIKMAMHAPGMPVTNVLIRDIVLDEELSDSLFSVTPPEGYRVQRMAMNASAVTETDLAAGVKMMVEANDGLFPDSLIGGPELLKKLDSRFGRNDASEKMAWAEPLARMMMFANLQEQNGFQYAGKGVKLRDADAPVAWWKGKDKGMYRVMYGDLSFADLPADKLPATAPAATVSCPASKPASAE